MGVWRDIVIHQRRAGRLHDWAVQLADARRFTIDAGARWEPFFPFTDNNGKLAVWSPGQQSQRYANAPLGVLYVGDPGVADSAIPRTWRNLAPRVGLAWDVMGDGK